MQQPIASRPSVPYAYDSADSDDQSTSDLKALFEEQQKDLSKDLLHLVAGSREKSKALVKSKLPVQREPLPVASINNSVKQEDLISTRQRSVTSKPSKHSIKDSEKLAPTKQAQSTPGSYGLPEKAPKESSAESNKTSDLHEALLTSITKAP